MNTIKFTQFSIAIFTLTIASGCASGKAYTNKIFAARNEETTKDSLIKEIKFLELESLQPNDENWVSTDIIMGRDAAGNTIALDNLAKIYPAKEKANADSLKIKTETIDALAKNHTSDTTSVKTENGKEMIAKNNSIDTFSTTNAVAKNITIPSERNKRSRDNQQ